MAIESLQTTLHNARASLLAERNVQGHWEGELSTSALSTATALVALGSVDETLYEREVRRAVDWLIHNQNEDGGWGDTTKSFSNISTTLLCWSAVSRFGGAGRGSETVTRASHWIRDYVGALSPALITETVKARYGQDRTFSVPILMLCAICGTLGEHGWKWVMPMPFQLAAFPRKWFAVMRLPVVSYALPALIAIGHARWKQGAGGTRFRNRVHHLWPRLSALLQEIQPASGGFLEAAPLTSFVSMALVAAGEEDHPVVKKGVEFLLATVREDGSWPIDTNLATWATTLAVKSLKSGSVQKTQEGIVDDPTLSGDGLSRGAAGFDSERAVLDWLLGQQYREVHPFTNTPPGGWAWTDLTGGVPDADDTPGALIALDLMDGGERAGEMLVAAESGLEWLLNLQNDDGGIPTFCKGWGALPFDRSSPDLTAHTLRAWYRWRGRMPEAFQSRIDEGIHKGLRYLARVQHGDGSWMPLWFGNQHRDADEGNPTYGTAMVTRTLIEIGEAALAAGGVRWLCENQNSDGGWGSLRDETPSTIEETSLAITALAIQLELEPSAELAAALERGAAWLVLETKEGTRFDSSPIGFYFAKLWYFERIYPLVWSVEALSHVAGLCDTTVPEGL